MQLKVTFLSSVYSFFQIGLGLLLHPYQTMQSLVQEKVFLWMTLFPSVVLAGITIVWRGVIVPTVRLLFSCQVTPVWACHHLPFVGNWVTFFCAYWQVLLLYLLVRFSKVYKS